MLTGPIDFSIENMCSSLYNIKCRSLYFRENSIDSELLRGDRLCKYGCFFGTGALLGLLQLLGANIGIDIGLDWSQLQTFLCKQPMDCTVLAPHAVGHMVLKL